MNSLINRLLMVTGSRLVAQGSWLMDKVAGLAQGPEPGGAPGPGGGPGRAPLGPGAGLAPLPRSHEP